MKNHKLTALTSSFEKINVAINVEDVTKGQNVVSRIICNLDGMKVESEDFHLFTTFINVRRELESKGYFLLCKGCLINVYPSGRQLTSSKAYMYTLGKRVSREDIVDIFDPIEDLQSLFSINLQKSFFEAWSQSIMGLDY